MQADGWRQEGLLLKMYGSEAPRCQGRDFVLLGWVLEGCCSCCCQWQHTGGASLSWAAEGRKEFVSVWGDLVMYLVGDSVL